MDGHNSGRFCAEPPPDSATQLKTELEASLEGSTKSPKVETGLDGTFKEKAEQAAIVLAERTPALDAFRTGVYALCQFHLNGAMKDEQVGPLFTRLIEAYENSAVTKPASNEARPANAAAKR